jgi:hypothetical protein
MKRVDIGSDEKYANDTRSLAKVRAERRQGHRRAHFLHRTNHALSKTYLGKWPEQRWPDAPSRDARGHAE